MFVSDWMTRKMYTNEPGSSVSDAARILKEKNVKHLPVVKGENVKGIISDRDIVEELVDITGVRLRGHRIFMTVKDTPGSIKDVADIIRKHGFALQGLLTSCEGVKRGMRNIVARTKGSGDFKALREELEGTYAGMRIQKG